MLLIFIIDIIIIVLYYEVLVVFRCFGPFPRCPISSGVKAIAIDQPRCGPQAYREPDRAGFVELSMFTAQSVRNQ